MSELYEGCSVIVATPDNLDHPRRGLEGHVALITREERSTSAMREESRDSLYWVEFRDAGDRLRLPFWAHELTPRSAFGEGHGR